MTSLVSLVALADADLLDMRVEDLPMAHGAIVRVWLTTEGERLFTQRAYPVGHREPALEQCAAEWLPMIRMEDAPG